MVKSNIYNTIAPVIVVGIILFIIIIIIYYNRDTIKYDDGPYVDKIGNIYSNVIRMPNKSEKEIFIKPDVQLTSVVVQDGESSITTNIEDIIDRTPINSSIKKCELSKPNRKSTSKGEEICRKVMEEIYDAPFISVRPDWLKNPETGHNLELDCYNDDLEIAVEYNGIQHYKYPNAFHKTKQEFFAQVRRDRYKATVCKQKKIYLIVIDYTVPHDMIKSTILKKLPENVRLLNEKK